jgi:hypothetical protein
LTRLTEPSSIHFERMFDKGAPLALGAMRLFVGLAVGSARRGKLAGLADRETAQFIRAGTKGEAHRLPQVVQADGVQSAWCLAFWRAGWAQYQAHACRARR